MNLINSFTSVLLDGFSMWTVKSIKKIRIFLSNVKIENKAFEPLRDKIYILSDSKGKRTGSCQWAIDTSRGGRWPADGVHFLQNNHATGGFRHGRSVDLFWHVMCDLHTFQAGALETPPVFGSNGATPMTTPSGTHSVINQIHEQVELVNNKGRSQLKIPQVHSWLYGDPLKHLATKDRWLVHCKSIECFYPNNYM